MRRTLTTMLIGMAVVTGGSAAPAMSADGATAGIRAGAMAEVDVILADHRDRADRRRHRWERRDHRWDRRHERWDRRHDWWERRHERRADLWGHFGDHGGDWRRDRQYYAYPYYRDHYHDHDRKKNNDDAAYILGGVLGTAILLGVITGGF